MTFRRRYSGGWRPSTVNWPQNDDLRRNLVGVIDEERRRDVDGAKQLSLSLLDRLHPVEWNIGESAGALAAFAHAQRVRPHAVRDTPALLADYQKRLIAQGVELRWPPGGCPP